jgi:hypothetical protein
MMRRGIAAVMVLLLVASCARFPVTDELTITFGAGDELVLVTAKTEYQLRPATREAQQRVDEARAAALAGVDPWSMRFSRLTPESESVTLERHRGALERVTRTVRIPAEELQRVFSDSSVTVDVLGGDGWRELALYPGSSSRATREQQRRFETHLNTWAETVARYFRAIDRLYRYLDEQPGRAEYLFAALFEEKGADGLVPPVLEEEEPLVRDVSEAIEAVIELMDERAGDKAATMAEEADLVFNPFPARIVVQVPGGVTSAEGFKKETGDRYVIDYVDLFAEIAALEGKWITPDPVAASMREQQPTAKQIALAPRRSTAVVNAREIADAVRERLARPRKYVLRWSQ